MIRLFTDSDTDMTPQECAKYGYSLISMPYILNGEQIYPYKDFDVFDAHTFYDTLRTLRANELPTTCALNSEDYKEYFEPIFAAGDDIFYVHFSAAMTATFQAMKLAMDELQPKYPERRLYTVDTNGITIISNLIVREIGQMFLDGATPEQVLAWAEAEVNHYACYFFADDLKFFAKSGRVSGIAATMGGLLGIKPIIYINSEGKMVNIAKEMGRRKALDRLVNYVVTLQDDIKNHLVIIGHTDALEQAQQLQSMLKAQLGDDLQTEIVDVNPTAGSHCGPNTIGVAFHAIHR